MSTTTPRRSRQQIAELIAPLLGEEPQSAASLARKVGLHERDVRGLAIKALDVLAARDQAKRIPDTPGTRDGGWVLASSRHESTVAAPQEITFAYEFDKAIPLDQWFVDESYQRPLTALAKRIERNFDPLLWQAPMLSDRGKRNLEGRYAIIDGQTRWAAARAIGIPTAPAQIFIGLSPEAEADIFWRVQKHRHGMVSWHRFRAQLRAGDEQSIKLAELARSVGYTLGDAPGQLRAMTALEACFAKDDYLLERTLADLHEAWPDAVPEGAHIKGLHFFFRHYPLDKRTKAEIDDERLVARLRTTGPDGLHRRAMAAKEIGGKGTADRWMATAIQAAYLSGGRAT